MTIPAIDFLTESDLRLVRRADGTIDKLIDPNGVSILDRAWFKVENGANTAVATVATDVSVVSAAATFTALTAADSVATPGKVALTSAGIHGLTTSPAASCSVYVEWDGTGVDGLYTLLSVDTTKILTIDLDSTDVVAFGTPTVTLAGTSLPLAAMEVPAGAMGATGVLSVTVAMNCTSSANDKTLTATFGTSAASVVVTSSTAYTGTAKWLNSTEATQVVFGFPGAGAAITGGTEDTATVVALRISGTNEVANEVISLIGYIVEITQ